VYPYMPTRPVTLVTGCDGSEMGCCANIPSPDTAAHRVMPDMRGFSATLASGWRGLSTFTPVRFFLPWLSHCLSRMGCGQSGKVSKTVDSCAALLRCVANAYEKHQNSVHTTRVQDIAVRCTHRFVQRMHEGKNPETKRTGSRRAALC
jgi:hypothetical protein